MSVLIHPDDWKTPRLVTLLTGHVLNRREGLARRAYDILTERIGYKPHEVYEMVRAAYPLTEKEIADVIN